MTIDRDTNDTKLYFVTGNSGKFNEVKKLLPEVEQRVIDLVEIQDSDPHAVITAKLQEAQKILPTSAIIVEDTSLSCDALKGLPGTFIKWFIQALGCQGLYDLVARTGNYGATARTILGYSTRSQEVYFFEGVVRGTLVPPVSNYCSPFGWDPLFKPEGSDKTFAHMSPEEKSSFSMRTRAVRQLQEFLKK